MKNPYKLANSQLNTLFNPLFNPYINLGTYENPIFIPIKHTMQSYRHQQRMAKKRRKSKTKKR